MGRIFVVGSEELAYLRAAVAEAGRAPIVVDVGIGPPRCDVDIARSEVAAHHPAGAHFLGSTDRGEAVAEPSLSPRACNRFGSACQS